MFAFAYPSRSLAPGFQWEAPALHCPAGNTLPGTERGADPAEAARRSRVMRTMPKAKTSGIWAPLSALEGSPEWYPRRLSACLWTALPPAGWAACLVQRSTQMPRSCGAARRDLESARVAGDGRRAFGFGTCFQVPCLSHGPHPYCWRNCCCRAQPKMEPGGAPWPEVPPRCLAPQLGQTAGASEAPPPWEMSWREEKLLHDVKSDIFTINQDRKEVCSHIRISISMLWRANKDPDSYYLWHIDRHQVILLSRSRWNSRSSPQDACTGVNSPLWVVVGLVQPFWPTRLLNWKGRWVGTNPLEGQIHGGLREPEPHAALEAVPFIGGTVVCELLLL